MSFDPNLLRQLLDSAFQEDGDTAIAIYTKVLTLDPINVEAFWRRGDEYHKTNRYENAILDFNAAIQIDSSFNVGYLFGDRGQSKEELGKFSEASACVSVRNKVKEYPGTCRHTPELSIQRNKQ